MVVFHAFPTAAQGGFTGVDVFFVISGYLISRIIWRGLEARSFTLAWFYGRRVLRLFPALVVVLLAALAAGRWLFLPDAYETLGKDIASAAVWDPSHFTAVGSAWFVDAVSRELLRGL